LGIAFAPRNSLIPGGTGDLRPEWQQPIGSDAAPARDTIPLVQAALCAVALGIALWATRGVSPLNPDTPSYLYFDPSRTVGYPAFLWLVKLLAGHAAAAVPVQMGLLALSLFLLGWSFHELLGRPRLSLAFQVFLLASPDLWRFSAELMTEALATASVALWCAQLLQLIRRPSRRAYLPLALISAVGMLVRPSLMVLFAGSAIAALLLKSRRQRASAVASLVPIGLGAYLLTPLALLLGHGSPVASSPMARGILQHTLFCDGAPAPDDADAAFVDRDSAGVRQYLDSAPPDVGIALQHLYSAPLRFDSIIPGLGRLHKAQAGWQTDSIVGRVARERLEANPLCYARSVLRNYWDLVTQDSLHVGAEGARVDQFLSAHPPVPIAFEPLLTSDAWALRRAAAELHIASSVAHIAIGRFGTKGSPLLLLVGRMLYGATALVGLACLAALGRRWRMGLSDRNAIALAAMGLVFHALFLGTAVVELSLIRYTIPAWPIVCTTLTVVSAMLLRLRDQSSATSSILGTATTHQMAPTPATAAVR
jgi:hypothetical protein